jgi:DnaK suppressor protein
MVAKKKTASRGIVKKQARKRAKRPAKKAAARKPAKPVHAARKTAKPAKSARKAAPRPAAAPRRPATANVAPARSTVKPTPKPAAKPVSRAAVIRLTPAPPREKQRPPAANRDYMNPQQIEAFRKQLLDWKRSLMEEVDRTVHHMQDEASNFPDPNDRATQEEEFALELRARDRERKLIKKIDEALLSLDTGDYGYCEICGVEIGIKRLEARPTATLCIDCKNLEEIKERQYG